MITNGYLCRVMDDRRQTADDREYKIYRRLR